MKNLFFIQIGRYKERRKRIREREREGSKIERGIIVQKSEEVKKRT